MIQLPGGASVARTLDVVRQAEEMLKKEEAIADYTSVVGLNFIDNYSQSNAAFIVVTLKPFEERKGAERKRRRDYRPAGHRNSGRSAAVMVLPLAPPPIIGLGTGGGFTYVLEDLRGGDPTGAGPGRCAGSPWRPTRIRSCARVFSTFSATNPSIYLDIDRDKAQILGVPLSNVFQALQASLGGYFVNNVNLFGRTWQVQVQAEAQDRVEHRRHLPHQCAQRRGQDDPAAQPRRSRGSSSDRPRRSATTICRR